MKITLPPCVLLVLSAALAMSPLASARQAQFSDQSAAAGLAFTHAVDPNLSGMMSMMNAGGAVGDFNRDGWPDLFLLGGGGRPDALYLNDGAGGFTDQAAAWGVAYSHHGFGAAVGDYDADGWPDIFVSSLGPANAAPQVGQHRLYHNDAGTGFSEVAQAAGVATTISSTATASSPYFGDYDHDGDLDLFVCCGMQNLGHANKMFQNQGDGTFVDVTQVCGADPMNEMGFAGGIVDLDGDLWPEVAFVSDWGGSTLFQNMQDGSFSATAVQPPMFNQLNGMGSAFADFDNDLKLDIYASGIYPTTGNILLTNLGGLQFRDDSVAAGVDDGAWGWGPAAIDVDNDSWLDIAAANGWTAPNDVEATRLFVNNHDGTYSEQGVAAGLTDTGQGRTLLRLDYDRDGDEDLVLLSNQGAAHLYRNDAGSAVGHWLQCTFDTARDPGLAPNGCGVYVYARLDDQWRVRQVDSATSYQGTHEALVHLGLGTHSKVDELRIEWPDGSLSFRGRTEADQRLAIDSGPAFSADDLVRGQPANLAVHGTVANRPVVFLYAPDGPGRPRPGATGSLQLDLQGEVHVVGLTMSDAQGEASVQIQVPPTAPLKEVGLQAVTLAGPFGGQLEKSRALPRVVQP